MRLVLSKPEISAAIEYLLSSRNFTPRDAAEAHIALMRETTETVRFMRDGKYVKVKEPPSLAAIKLYWDLTLPNHVADSDPC